VRGDKRGGVARPQTRFLKGETKTTKSNGKLVKGLEKKRKEKSSPRGKTGTNKTTPVEIEPISGSGWGGDEKKLQKTWKKKKKRKEVTKKSRLV